MAKFSIEIPQVDALQGRIDWAQDRLTSLERRHRLTLSRLDALEADRHTQPEVPGSDFEVPDSLEPVKPRPCPFCGCGRKAEEGPRIAKGHTEGYLGFASFFRVSCASCGSLGPDCETGHAAIAAWNRRASR